jgi:hypothetical protein
MADIKVTLPNGEKRIVLKSKDFETRDGHIYSPRQKDGVSGYGVCFETLESATTWMFQQDCKHKIVENTAKPTQPNFIPHPFKCSVCNKHFLNEYNR